MYRSAKPLEALHPLQMYPQQTSILHAQYKTYDPSGGTLSWGLGGTCTVVTLCISNSLREKLNYKLTRNYENTLPRLIWSMMAL